MQKQVIRSKEIEECSSLYWEWLQRIKELNLNTYDYGLVRGNAKRCLEEGETDVNGVFHKSWYERIIKKFGYLNESGRWTIMNPHAKDFEHALKLTLGEIYCASEKFVHYTVEIQNFFAVD